MGSAEGGAPVTSMRWPGPWQVLALSAWFGLLAGLLEVLTKVVCTALGRAGHLYQTSRHFFWLVPVTNLLIFLLLGGLLALLVRVWPRLGSWCSVRVLTALMLLPAFLVAFPEVYTWACLILAWGVAVRIGGVLQRRAVRLQRIALGTLPLQAAIVVGVAGWVLGQDWYNQRREFVQQLPPKGSPNVLFVVLDTVRADRLSVYGYPRKTTPTLERIASEGVRFDAARSTSPWTLPSHGSMFTGRLPHELQAEWLAPIRGHFPTLAGYLGSQGYATAGFVANTLYCAYDTGLGAGFTHYEDYTLEQMDAFLSARLAERALVGFFQLSSWAEAHGSTLLNPITSLIDTYVYNGKRKDASMINRQFLNWLAGRAQTERPFFAFLNYMDAHEPYLPPRPSDCRFGLRPTGPEDLAVLQNWEQIDKLRLDQRLRTLASDFYDNCLNYLDRQLQVLFMDLARQHVLEHTLVVVVADHGESFGEHDLYLHGDSLYRSETRVPLLIMMPWFRPTRNVINDTVSLRDIPATIVDLLGLGPESPFTTPSLARFWKSSSPKDIASDCAISELKAPNPANPNQGRSPAQNGPLTALTRGRYTYIFSDMSEELYDEASDPAEEKNLAGDEAMKPVLEQFRNLANRVSQPHSR